MTPPWCRLDSRWKAAAYALSKPTLHEGMTSTQLEPSPAEELERRRFYCLLNQRQLMEKIMKIRNLIIAIALLTSLLGTGLGQTREERKDDDKEHSLPCSQQKQVINGQGPTGKVNLDRSDFPDNMSPTTWTGLENPATNQFNQTKTDQFFAYTFKFPGWPSSNGKECCRCTEGATLTVKFKALQGGGPNSSSSWNDDVVVYSSLAPGPTHQVVGQRIWSGTVVTGQTETLTFKIPCKFLANGHLSILVEDDTAVVSAELSLSRCCLENVR